MTAAVIPFLFLWTMSKAEDYYYNPYNVTRSTLSGIAEYRSALTLDWLAAEDLRQRELASAFETEPAPPARHLPTDCIAYARPASGKVARLMLELIKNLEGDDGTIISDLIQALIRSKLLVETSMLDAEPDLEALVKTPGVMMGEPHTTFPRVLAMVWMAATDPTTTKKLGWCPINKVNKYLSATKPMHIAKHMRALDPVIARVRFIMEEFIQHITPINMYDKKVFPDPSKRIKMFDERRRTERTPTSTHDTERSPHVAMAQSATTLILESDSLPSNIEESQEFINSDAYMPQIFKSLLILIVL